MLSLYFMEVGPTLGGVKSIILDPSLFQSDLGYEFLTKYSTDSMSDLGLTCIAFNQLAYKIDAALKLCNPRFETP